MKYRIFLVNSLLKPLFLGFLMLTISRLLFFLFNFSFFSRFAFVDILQTLGAGLLFDTVFLSYGLLPFILLQLSPFSFKFPKTARLYFTFILGTGILMNLIDSVYFRFSGKRTGIEFIYLLNDPANPITDYMTDYWYLLPLFFLLLYGTYRLYPSFPKNAPLPFSVSSLGWSLLIVALVFAGMRGGLRLKPLKSADASLFVKSGLEALALNTPFQLISSIDSKKPVSPFAPPADFDKTTETVAHTLSPIVKKDRNIVLIILESFGRDYAGFLTQKENEKSLTPFLDSLAKVSLVFPNCYANGTKSIDAVPALFASLPNLLEQPFIYSWYQANTVRGLHYYLSNKGYDCSFYHGAANGTMGFESFLKKSGKINYFGLSQYGENRSKHYDGSWGIYDHYYLEYFSRELTQKPQPYFSAVFTLSSHHPYNIPKEFADKQPKERSDIHKSIAYTDTALSLFFEKRSKAADHYNTIYIVTGDHSSHSDKKYFYTPKGKMELFCIVHDPAGEIAAGVNNKIVQQLDIMPTVLHLTHSTDSFFSLGSSFFDTARTGRAFFWADGAYHLIKEEHIYSENSAGEKNFCFQPKQYYKPSIPFTEKSYLKKEMESELKHLIWLFHKRLEENRFY